MQTFPLIQPHTQVDAFISPVEQTIPHINVQSNNNQTEKMKSEVNFNSNVQTFPISQPYTQNTESVMPNRPDQVQDFTKFLLKKDLLISRLTRFDDQPQTFIFWKAQFEEIMKELEATNTEELDLLTKWLGPTSSKYAASIRSSNVSNPAEALRKIWERLNERFGSPELLESMLMSKLSVFPKLTNRDNVKLYDLLDLILEFIEPFQCFIMFSANTW